MASESELNKTDGQLPARSETRHKQSSEIALLLRNNQQREAFFAAMKRGYAELRADENAWTEYQNELTLWDVTLTDGLDDL